MLSGCDNGGVRPTFEPQDPDFERRIRESFAAQGAMSTLGVVMADLGPGWVEVELTTTPAVSQQDGFIHAGVLAAAMDSACGYAALSLMPHDARVLTVEFKVDLLRPATAERFRANGWVVKPGRTLTVCQGHVVPAQGGRPVAMMTATMMRIGS